MKQNVHRLLQLVMRHKSADNEVGGRRLFTSSRILWMTLRAVSLSSVAIRSNTSSTNEAEPIHMYDRRQHPTELHNKLSVASAATLRYCVTFRTTLGHQLFYSGLRLLYRIDFTLKLRRLSEVAKYLKLLRA